MTQEQQDDRKAFYAQYFGQLVLMDKLNGLEHIDSTFGIGINESYLSLKPLSAITDEDAIELLQLKHLSEIELLTITRKDHSVCVSYRWKSEKVNNPDGWSYSEHGVLFDRMDREQVDLARKLGYLVGFRQYSTQQLLDMGWAKIKEG